MLLSDAFKQCREGTCTRCDKYGNIKPLSFGPDQMLIEIDGKPLKKCPLSKVTPQIYNTVELFMHYQAGFLPKAGGVFDQPCKLMKAFNILSHVYADVQEERAKKRGG